MIQRVDIEGLRGIQKGTLEGFAPLTILVGPNGCGKSTVLDALLLSGSDSPAQAVAQTVQRRPGAKRGARWLFWKGSPREKCIVHLHARHSPWHCVLGFEEKGTTDRVTAEIPGVNARVVVAAVGFDRDSGEVVEISARVYADAGSRTRNIVEEPSASATKMLAQRGCYEIRLVDSRLFSQPVPLHQLYTETVEQGGARQAEGILREVVKGAVNLQILAEGDTPVLHLVFENRSVPAALAGDGVQMLLRLILELAARREGVVLLEEPEVHQHPGAIRQGAAAILAAVRRGIQVILTTHSLELIDSLLSGGEEDLDGTAVFRLNLEEGILKSTRLSGREALVARSQIEDDLR